MKLYFIVNEQAGNRQGAKKWKQFKKTIRIPYEAHITQHEKHAIEIIHKLGRRGMLFKYGFLFK